MIRRSTFVQALLVALLSATCAGGPQPCDETSSLTGSRTAGQGSIDAVALLEEHGALLPRDTVVVAVLNFGHVLRTNLVGGMGTMPADWDSSAMLRDMSEFSVKRIGLDVTKVETIVVAGTDSKQFVMLAIGDFADASPTAIDGTEVGFMATGKPGVWALTLDPEHARFTGQVLSGQVPTMAEAPARARLAEVLSKAGPGVLTVAAQVGDGELSRELTASLPVVPAAVAVSLSNEVALVVGGDKATLDALGKMLEGALAMLKAEMQQKMTTLDQADFAEGMTTIAGFHLVDGLTVALAPKIEGDFMSVRFAWPKLIGMVPMMGISAAVAIPAFLNYIKRSKVSEAQMNLRRLQNGAELYFKADQTDEKGALVKSQRFPQSTTTTPGPSCCADNGNDKCEADPGAWSQPGWREANFVLEGDHYFVYEMINEGGRNGVHTMVLKAYGDLDCDGQRSVDMVRLTGDEKTREVEATPVFLEDPSTEFE